MTEDRFSDAVSYIGSDVVESFIRMDDKLKNKSKNRRRRVIKWVSAVAACVSVAVIFGVLMGNEIKPEAQNTQNLNELMEDFVDAIEEFDGDIQIVETASLYGNLCGNGNKINYFGAVLVEKESLEDIDELIAVLDNDFEFVAYCDQKTQKVEYIYLERFNPSYETDVSGGEYVSIMFFNSWHPNSDMRDPLGH